MLFAEPVGPVARMAPQILPREGGTVQVQRVEVRCRGAPGRRQLGRVVMDRHGDGSLKSLREIATDCVKVCDCPGNTK